MHEMKLLKMDFFLNNKWKMFIQEEICKTQSSPFVGLLKFYINRAAKDILGAAGI